MEVEDFWQIDLRFQRAFTLGRREGHVLRRRVQRGRTGKALSRYTGAVDGNDRNDYLASLHFPAGEYSNIPGDDVVGDYRPEDVPYQPLIPLANRGQFGQEDSPNEMAIYYERETGSYLVYRDGAFQDADPARVREVLDTKAYINMPNQTYLNFLNPRDIFFGIRVSL